MLFALPVCRTGRAKNNLKTGVRAMKQRKWTADEKLAIVMEGHKENSPVEVFEKCKKLF